MPTTKRLLAIALLVAACDNDDPEPVHPDAMMPDAPAPPPRWQVYGPETSFVMEVAFDPMRPDRVFLGLDDGGGVWRSTDGGQTFQYARTPVDVSGWAVAIDPRSPDHVYGGDVYGRGIYASHDGGETWAYANTGLATFGSRIIGELVVDPLDSRVYAATAEGVRFSTDHGATWNRLPATAGDLVGLPINRLAAFATASTVTLLAATEEETTPVPVPSRVFASTDRGATWRELTGLAAAGHSGGISRLRVDKNHRLYVATPFAIYRSANLQTFTALPVIPQSFASDIAIDPVDPRIVYVTGDMYFGPAVYVSRNDGVSFSVLAQNLDGVGPLTLAVDPAKPSRLYLGAYADLFISSDRGTTWQRDNKQIEQGCAHSVVSTPQRTIVGLLAHAPLAYSKRNAFALEGGALRELPITNDVASLAVFPADPNRIIAGTFATGAWYSPDGAQSFTQATGVPADTMTFAAWAGPDNIALVSGANQDFTAAGIWRSTDGGKTYTHVESSFVVNDFAEAGGQLFAVGGQVIVTSSDRGLTWRLLIEDHNATDLLSIVALDAAGKDLLVGDAKGRLLRSADNGGTWKEAATTFRDHAGIAELLTDPTHPDHVYLGAFAGNLFTALERRAGLWRSTDRGATWERVAAKNVPMSTNIWRMAWDPTVKGRLYAVAWCSGLASIDLPR